MKELSPAAQFGNHASQLAKAALAMQRPRVSYFYDPEMGSFYYGSGHPMKPTRLKMTCVARQGDSRLRASGHRSSLAAAQTQPRARVRAVQEDGGLPAAPGAAKGGARDELGAPASRGRVSSRAVSPQLTQFHSEDYVDFLRRVNPDNHKDFLTQVRTCVDGRSGSCRLTCVSCARTAPTLQSRRGH
jgi:acetoin utilization deacetylase AcuC-like enzyme